MGAESRLTELKLVLPPAPQPVATYVTAVRQGELLYVSGHGPFRSDKTMITGKIGADLDIDQGKAAARQTGLAILATIRSHLGSLDKVVRLVKVLGMLNCTNEFSDHPLVINGFSDLMVEVFGEFGKGAQRRRHGLASGWYRCRGGGDLPGERLIGLLLGTDDRRNCTLSCVAETDLGSTRPQGHP